MKWLKADYRNELYTRITKRKAQRLIKSGRVVYAWTYDNMGYVEERVTLGDIKGYIEYLTAAYNGRIRFYLKDEKGKQ